MWSCQHGDGADLEGGQEALVGPQRWPFGIAVVGGPTAVIDIASLTAERAAAAAEVLGSQHIVVVHQDGWSHFREGPERTKAAFESAGTSRRLCAAPAGHWCGPAGDGAGFPDAAR